MEWTAEIALRTRARLTEKVLEEAAALGGAAAGAPGKRRLEATFTVSGETPAAAAAAAIAAMTAIAAGDVIAIEIMTTAEADRRLEEPAFPRLVGMSEVAALLNISRQRVAVLRTRNDFPSPIAELAAGPIWRASDLSTFAGGWHRQPGRPKQLKKEDAESVTHPA